MLTDDTNEIEAKAIQSLIVDPDPSKALYLSEEEKQVIKSEQLDAMFWINQVTMDSKQEAQPWFDECKSAWREFQGQRQDGTWRPSKLWYAEVYPRYWSDTELMLPALYSKTPKAVSKRKFNSRDPIARTATTVNDRLAEWLMQTGGYDRTMEMCALGFLNTNRQTARIFFEDYKVKRKERIYVTPAIAEDGVSEILLTGTGELIPDDVVVLSEDDGRPYYEKETEELLDRPRIVSKPVQFDKVRISPGARNESEIWWIAYAITITKKQAAKLFGDKIKSIPVVSPETNVSQSDWSNENRVRKSDDLFTYWEVWNKRDKEVYFLHESYKQGFLKKEKDFYKLIGFFPSPKFMMDNMRYDSMYPAPDFTQCKDSYEQMHILYKRINQTTRAIKASILFDGNENDLANFFREVSDNEGIGVSKWAETQQEGGFENKIFIPDFSRLGGVLNTLVQAFERQKIAIDELRGIPDILRGASDPATSATAEKIKDRKATLRFGKKKKAILEFGVELLQMMLDLAYKTFDDEYIADIVGLNQMDEGDKQNFASALKILKNDEERVIRIDIETDSMVLFDDLDRKEQAIEALNVIGGYVQNISQANPIMLPPLIGLLEQVVRAMDNGKGVEDTLSQSFDALIQQANQPPQPPQPDPDLVAKLNAEQGLKIAQIQSEQALKEFEIMSKERLEMQKLGVQSNLKGSELQLKGADINRQTIKDQTDAQLKASELQLKGADLNQKALMGQADLSIKADGNNVQREWMMLEASDSMGTKQLKANEQALKSQEINLKAQTESVRLQIEQALASLKEYETVLSEREKMMTEVRLQKEFENDKDSEALESLKEMEVVKTQEETKQIEALARTREAPQVQVVIPQQGSREQTEEES